MREPSLVYFPPKALRVFCFKRRRSRPKYRELLTWQPHAGSISDSRKQTIGAPEQDRHWHLAPRKRLERFEDVALLR
jgi:hypothetical protein